MNRSPRRRSRIAALGLLAAVLALACGVPLDPVELTASATGEPSTLATELPPATLTPGATSTPSVLPTGTPQAGIPRPTATPSLTAAACAEAAQDTTPANGAALTPVPSVAPSARLRPPSGVRPASAYEVLSFAPDARLEALVLTALGDARDAYAVVVKDLATGQGAAVNGDRVFFAASVFKLLVMYEAFNQVAQGKLSLDTQVQITPYYESFGLRPRSTTLCQRLSVREALAAMMSFSDNAAAVLLQDLVGTNNINASMQSLGLKETRMLPEDLPLTAADTALLLEAIGRGLAIDKGSSEAMARLMLGDVIDNGVKGGVPAGTVVAHKTGNLSNATHDVAIVYSPKATYLLVVLTDRGYEVSVTRAVSQAVYGYFNP